MGHDGKSTLVFNGAAIRDRAEMLSVTDMWKAGGSIDAKRPTDWLALASTKEFVACVDASFNAGKSGIETIRGGRQPGTWAHWQIALAYAKYLSPEFHMWCNTVVRDRMEGRTSVQPFELNADVRSAIGGIVKSVVHKELAEALAMILPQMVTAAIAGQTHILRQGKTAGQIWRAHDLPKLKGAAVWFSNRLKLMGCQIEHNGRGELGVVRARLFDPDKVEAWLSNGGIFAVRQYVQERQGQGRLRLVPV